MKTLRKGCRGSEVKTLQGYLNLIQDGITEQQQNEYIKVIEANMEAEMRLKREEVNDAQE